MEALGGVDQVEQGGGEVLGDDWRRRKRWEVDVRMGGMVSSPW